MDAMKNDLKVVVVTDENAMHQGRWRKMISSG